MMKLAGYRLIKATTSGLVALILSALPISAQIKNVPGVTESEIKIGQTMSYSGPAALYSTVGSLQAAYFKMINERGGVNGRKINFITVDDGFSAPKTVEMTRQLVESDNVSFIYSTSGGASSAAVQKYLNDRKIPQLFVFSGARRFSEGKQFPWTTGFQPTFFDEASETARYVLRKKPNAKIAMLYANDESGRDYAAGFKSGLGDDGKKLIVAEMTYETTDATVDSLIRQLKASGADVFYAQTVARFTPQAIRTASDIGWKPMWLMPNTSSSIPASIAPAGFSLAQGFISTKYMKEPGDPRWQDDPAIREWREWMAKYYPGGKTDDFYNLYSYLVAQVMVRVLEQCGNDLSRENIMKQALSLDMESSLLLPGLKVSTSASNHDPVSKVVFHRFEGEQWVPLSD